MSFISRHVPCAMVMVGHAVSDRNDLDRKVQLSIQGKKAAGVKLRVIWMGAENENSGQGY
jgi:hypothetical protein